MKNKIFYIKKEDNNFQRFEVLKRNRNKRHKNSDFFVEGVRNINQAIKNNWEIKNIIFSDKNNLSEWARNIINSVKAEEVFKLSEKLMDKISSKEDSSEIILIVKMRQNDLINEIETKNPLFVILDRSSNRGNLGTIIRSCDALNFDGLIITGHSVDLFDPDTISSSMGSFFKLPTLRISSNEEVNSFLNNMKNKYPNLQIIGTSAHAETNVDECDFTRPTVLMIGNETNGLNSYYKNICDDMITIPIGGSASSLNVACAASIIMYEVQRQRNFKIS